MIIPVSLGKDSYDIILERGAIKKAGELLGIDKDRKVLVVTDTGVPRIYADTVAWCFEDSHIFIFPEGEKSKNFDTYRVICQTLSDAHFTRKDAVIAVGGGVVGDMAGFAAATYMRGIDFYNIPTTLLSQVDSSIGGKTAIDLGKFKNIIGAFHQPKKVIIDPDVLSTLPERQIANGLAESIKMAATFDKDLFELFLEENYMDNIEKIIEGSLKIKKYVVQQDEKETGLRKVLNFGHTIGHGIEASAEYGELYHGECVALGMLAMCSEKVKDKMIRALKNAYLPTEYAYDKEKVYEAMCHDKKSSGKTITAVRCDEIGTFRFQEMTNGELRELL
jgi:3-dehydroquinate synthase